MKTDSIFYRLFQSYPASFFELLNIPAITAENYDFTSIEVKQLAFRLDGLFLPKSEHQLFYLLEVQMQPDDELYHRIFAELFLYLRQYRPRQPWQIVVVYPSRGVERIELVNLGLGVMKLIIEPEEQAVEVAKGLLAQVEQETEASLQNAFLELIETIIVYKFPQKTREEIATMLGLGDLTQTRFYQEAFGEGRQEGEYLAKLATIRRLAGLNLPVEVIAQGVEMSVVEVQRAIASEEGYTNTQDNLPL